MQKSRQFHWRHGAYTWAKLKSDSRVSIAEEEHPARGGTIAGMVGAGKEMVSIQNVCDSEEKRGFRIVELEAFCLADQEKWGFRNPCSRLLLQVDSFTAETPSKPKGAGTQWPWGYSMAQAKTRQASGMFQELSTITEEKIHEHDVTRDRVLVWLSALLLYGL